MYVCMLDLQVMVTGIPYLPYIVTENQSLPGNDRNLQKGLASKEYVPHV